MNPSDHTPQELPAPGVDSFEASEARYRTLFEHAPDAVVVFDLETGKFVEANENATRLFGYTRDELFGLGPVDVSPELQPDGAPSEQGAREMLRSALDYGSPVFEWTHQDRAGDPIECEIRLIRMPPYTRQLVRGSIRDIRERKAAEIDLARRERQFRTLAENSPDWIVRVDRDLRRTYVNPAVADAAHVQPEDLLGKRPTESFPGSADMEAWEEGLRICFETGEPQIVERETNLGEMRVLQISIVPEFDERGAIDSVLSVTRDITSIRKALDAEVRLASVVGSASEAIMSTNLEGTITSWNRGAERMYGYSAAEVLGTTTEFFFRARDPKERAAIRRRLLAGETIEGYTSEWPTADGRMISTLTTFFPLRDGTGTIVGTASIARDLTGEHRALRALEVSEEQLRLALETARMGTWRYLPEADRMEFSEQAAAIYGRKPEDMPATMRETVALTHPDDAESARNRLKKGIPPGSLPREYRIRLPGGDYRWISGIGDITASDGTVSGILVDIHERRLAEEALRESEARFRAVVESVSAGVWVHDGSDVLMVNAALERMTGYDRSVLLQRDSFARFVDPDQLRTMNERGAARLRGEPGEATYEVAVTRADGQIRLWELVGSRIDFRGAPASLVSAFDVTERRRSEEALRESEARFRAVVNSAPVGIIIFDGESIIEANPAAGEIFGVDPRRLTEPGFIDSLTDAETSQAVRDRGVARLRGEDVRPSFEVQARHSSGTMVILHMSATIIELDNRPASLVTVLDITERRVAEELLRESEARFRAVANSAPVGIIIFDGESIIEVNPAAAEILGERPETLREPGYMAAMTDEDMREQLRGSIQATLSGANAQRHFEARATRASGDPLYLQVNLDRMELNGRPAALITLLDMTERRLAEESLRASEEQFRQVVESISAGVWVYNSGEIVLVNAALERMTGYSREQLLTRSFFSNFIDEEQLGLMRENARRILAGERPLGDGEIRITRRDGEERVWQPVASRIIFRGEPAAIVSAFDVTERREGEDALRVSEARFRSVVDNSPDYITRIGKDLRHEFVNRTAEFEAGLHPADVIGRRADELGFPEELGALWVSRHAQVFETGEPLEYEYEIARPGGQPPVYRRARLIPEKDAAGEVHHVLSIVTDITAERTAEDERERLDLQMQHAQKLESLGVLAGGIAHDFNNLLVAILGNAGLALVELPPESPARQTVQAIETAAQRAAELTRQMLAYSGKGRFIVEPLNLSRVVEEMAHLLEVSVSKQATLKYRFAANLPSIEADATQIRQIIMNLIINASDAIGERSGVISLTTGIMHADRAYLEGAYMDGDIPEGDYVYLEVADTGSGMDEETRARIFDPFFTTKFTGRGLGLAAVLGIVRGHRGAIKLYSEAGQGTTFKVLFPAAPSAIVHSPPETAPASPFAQAGRTVLVVDDDETVRTVTRRILERSGLNVLLAADGVEGVATYSSTPGIDLVLLDMTMPRMDGEQTFRELRRIDPSVRVVLTSGYNEQDATERFAGKGLAGFIQKPYRPADLIEAISSALRGD